MARSARKKLLRYKGSPEVIITTHHIAGYNPLSLAPYWHDGRYEDCDECQRADEFWASVHINPVGPQLSRMEYLEQQLALKRRLKK